MQAPTQIKPKTESKAENTYTGEMELGGKKLPIAMNLNAICDAEELTGNRVSVFAAGLAGARDVRGLIWAALREGSRVKSASKQPDPRITPEWVGAQLSTDNMGDKLAEVLALLSKLKGGGKDDRMLAPYVPTPEEVIVRALELAELAPGEVFFDLGCGEGTALEIAARQFHAGHVEGYELDHSRWLMSKSRMIVLKDELSQGIGTDLTFNVLEADLRACETIQSADVVFIYLLQASNQLIKEWLEKNMKPDARLVSHDFSMDDWLPYKTETMTADSRSHSLYVYKIGAHLPQASNGEIN